MTNGNGNDTQHSDWDERREQLSAYLDGELADAERERLEAHLTGCADCRRELAELRQVRALLRALPTPALPRSFTIPVEEPAAARSLPSSHPTTVGPRVARRESRWARATQWTGGLAASIGLLLILGSALASTGPHFMNGGAASYAPQTSSQRSSNASTTGAGGAATHPPETGTQDQSTRSPRGLSSSTPTAAPSATNAGTDQHLQNGAGAPATPSTGAIVGLTGAGLAGGGTLLFVGGTISRRRRGKKR